MVFSSSVFLLLFLPIVLLIYYNPIIKSRTFRNVFLFFASLVFYAWGEPVFVFLMLFSVLITWALGLWLEKASLVSRKIILTIGISLHVLLLFIFKYLSFLAQQLGLLICSDFSYISIVLPIGISFFTFQLMSYLFDVYYGSAKAQKNVLYVGLYVALFPQLIAGPIVRYNEIEDAISNRQESRSDITEGMARFIYGLAKKVLLANYVAQIADNIFLVSAEVPLAVMTAWLGAIAYALQIYFDFSAYSDMAIGLGRMFGFRFSENFNYPYISKSVTEFWRRWHISLSTWFRDYVYIPLGGSRVNKARWIRNLLVVWLLTGIWHGANWTFLIWGLFYFTVLLIEKLTGFADRLKGFSHIYTMLIVLLAWVIFRSDSIGMALQYIGWMFGFSATGFIDAAFTEYILGSGVILPLAILLCLPIYPTLKKKLIEFKANNRQTAGTVDLAESLLLLLLFIISLIVTVGSNYNPFIYFNF